MMRNVIVTVLLGFVSFNLTLNSHIIELVEKIQEEKN